jgi:hypothetical protein
MAHMAMSSKHVAALATHSPQQQQFKHSASCPMRVVTGRHMCIQCTAGHPIAAVCAVYAVFVVCRCCRFIKNNLLVELTTSKYAAAFAWLLRRHTIMAYSLYMAGDEIVCCSWVWLWCCVSAAELLMGRFVLLRQVACTQIRDSAAYEKSSQQFCLLSLHIDMCPLLCRCAHSQALSCLC